jgi:aspartyl-tRNA synthetase
MELNIITDKLNMLGLEVVIGLETHIRLNTQTKLFCSCANEDSELPNSNICPVCKGQMGVLPAVNKEAVRKTIYFPPSTFEHIPLKLISKKECYHW